MRISDKFILFACLRGRPHNFLKLLTPNALVNSTTMSNDERKELFSVKSNGKVLCVFYDISKNDKYYKRIRKRIEPVRFKSKLDEMKVRMERVQNRNQVKRSKLKRDIIKYYADLYEALSLEDEYDNSSQIITIKTVKRKKKRDAIVKEKKIVQEREYKENFGLEELYGQDTSDDGEIIVPGEEEIYIPEQGEQDYCQTEIWEKSDPSAFNKVSSEDFKTQENSSMDVSGDDERKE